MSRNSFYSAPSLPIPLLLLDTTNARIRAGVDQANCMERILRKSPQIVELAKHIAQNGLSTIPILVSKDENDKWVVRDGNRRVASLKLLLNPDLCANENVRGQLRSIAEQNKGRIPGTVDCLACDDEQTMVAEILLRHNGTQGGIGQLNWGTYPRTAFMMQHNRTDPNRRVGQLLLWSEQQGIEIDDEFPVTNLTRFLSTDNLTRLGFDVTSDEIRLRFELKTCIRIAQKIVTDFGALAKSVNEVFTSDQQKTYIEEIERQCGGARPGFDGGAPAQPDSNGTDTGGQNARPNTGGRGGNGNGNGDEGGANKGDGSDDIGGGTSEDGGGRGSGGSNGEGQTAGRGSKPKARWDRPKLFVRGIYPGRIGNDYWKVQTVVADLCKLKTGETTLAVAVLLRVLIEMSTLKYLAAKNLKDEQSLRRNLAKAVRHMHEQSALSEVQRDVILGHTETDNDLTNITSLQRFVHEPNYHPDRQTLHTLWDHVCPFVVNCWTPE